MRRTGPRCPCPCQCTVSKTIAVLGSGPHSYGEPYRVNRRTHYPIAKGVRDSFSQDIVRAIHIRVDPSSARCLVEAMLQSPSAEYWRFLARPVIDGHRICIEEARLAGVAFFGYEDSDPHQLRFVG